MAISHSSVISSAAGCFIGIEGQGVDGILPGHFCVLFSVLSQIRGFLLHLATLTYTLYKRISC